VIARLEPLSADRFGEARELVGTVERPRELLERAAVARGSRETQAVAAYDDMGAMSGIALFGEVAGTLGAGVLLWTVVRPDVRRTGVARALVDRAVTELHAGGARVIVAEVPGSAAFDEALHLLAVCGFRRESEVPDFYGNGVPLVLLGHRLE
jgi:ribosomal protein S18 acetylase RimI-like enzyme